MASLRGKVVAVTGAASGIGRATSKILFSRGASLALADVQSELLADLAKELVPTQATGQKVTYAVVDVSKRESVDGWIKQAAEEHGKLDGAANLAGVARFGGRIGEVSDEEWDKVMNVNCFGVFNCMRAELNVMTSGGSIVNAASVAGLMGLPHMAAYCASKHAVVGLTKTAAKEYGGQGIRVNAIAPGIISTPMTDTPEARESLSGQVVPLGGRKGDPSEVGNLIGFLLSDDASYISGSVMQIDGAWQA